MLVNKTRVVHLFMHTDEGRKFNNILIETRRLSVRFHAAINKRMLKTLI